MSLTELANANWTAYSHMFHLDLVVEIQAVELSILQIMMIIIEADEVK